MLQIYYETGHRRIRASSILKVLTSRASTGADRPGEQDPDFPRLELKDGDGVRRSLTPVASSISPRESKLQRIRRVTVAEDWKKFKIDKASPRTAETNQQASVLFALDDAKEDHTHVDLEGPPPIPIEQRPHAQNLGQEDPQPDPGSLAFLACGYRVACPQQDSDADATWGAT